MDKKWAFMTDSSFYNSPSGGRRYHLQDGRLGALCGVGPLSEDRPANWEMLPDVLKCKRCKRCKGVRKGC